MYISSPGITISETDSLLRPVVFVGVSVMSALPVFFIYKALNQLSKRCKELGITTVNHNNIEGDDWIWYWSRRLNSDGINCIIWSSDNDLKQLVNMNSDKCFTVWWNEANGLYVEDFPEDEAHKLEIIKEKNQFVLNFIKNDNLGVFGGFIAFLPYLVVQVVAEIQLLQRDEC